jgi:hypothetical protein
MTEIQNNPNISTERIMGIGPGDRFRIKSKLLEDEVREVEVEGFDIQRIEDPEQEEEQDPEVFDLDEVLGCCLKANQNTFCKLCVMV